MATFQAIIDAARVPLNDSVKERYTDALMMTYAQDALREAAVLRPDLFSVTGQITCVAGVEQSVPDGAWFIVDVLSNNNGEEVYEADYKTFCGFNPAWRNDPAGPTEIWMRYMSKGPNNRFFIYPKAALNDQIDAVYVVCDVASFTLTDDVPFDSVYHPAIQYYVTARAEAVDDQHTVTQRTAQLAAAFATLMGVGGSTEEVKT